jgi:hypothetical protein
MPESSRRDTRQWATRRLTWENLSANRARRSLALASDQLTRETEVEANQSYEKFVAGFGIAIAILVGVIVVSFLF